MKMSTKARNKLNKKSLETTLGKAANTNGNKIDLSHLRMPINIGVQNLRQVLNLFETATDEVRQYISYECDIMYECRICRSIFRSLANFISHKRDFCQGTVYSSYLNNFKKMESEVIVEDEVALDAKKKGNKGRSSSRTTPSPVNCKEVTVNDENKKDLSTVVSLLQEKQSIATIAEKFLNEDISNESKSVASPDEKQDDNCILLQKVETTSNAVYQTFFKEMADKLDTTMKTEVMEIHSILDDNEVILGSDGKILEPETSKGKKMSCTVCNKKFSTKKTLSYHIKYKHNLTKYLYQCPLCSNTFASTWGVFKHLYSIHEKTQAQVRKLRSQINTNRIRRDEMPSDNLNNTKNKDSILQSETKQWMNSFEKDNDLQRCGGCGRKFERKAALHSHSQLCAKRLAVCNSIKDSKKNEADRDGEISEKCNYLEEDLKRRSRRKPIMSQRVWRTNNSNHTDESNVIKDNQEETKVTENVVKDEENNLDQQIQEQCLLIQNYSEKHNENDIVEINDDDFQGFSTKENQVNEMSESVADILIPKTEDTSNETIIPLIEIKEEKMSEVDPTETVCNLEDNLECPKIEAIPDEPIHTLEETIEVTQTSASENKKRQNDSFVESLHIKRKKEEKRYENQSANLTLELKSLNYMNKETLTCVPCNKTCKSKKVLMKHMANHFSWFRYECEICQFRSYTKSKCERHLFSRHDSRHMSSIIHIPIVKTFEYCTEFKSKRSYSYCDSSAYESSICNTTNESEMKEEPPVLERECEEPSREFVSPVPSTHLFDQPIDYYPTDKLSQDDSCVDFTPSQLSQSSNKKLTSDPKLLNMIMTVIFGESTEPSIIEKKTENDKVVLQKTPLSPTSTAAMSSEKNKNATVIHDLDEPTVLQPILRDYSRPIRNRVSSVREDFVYDMTKIHKQKGDKVIQNFSNCKKLKNFLPKSQSNKSASVIKATSVGELTRPVVSASNLECGDKEPINNNLLPVMNDHE